MLKLRDLLFEDEYQTKEGDEITFEFERDVASENRGWVVHRLTAYVKSKEVGYLKVGYIPKKEWEKRYSGAVGFVRWMDNISKECSVIVSDYNDIDELNSTLSKELDSWDNWIPNNKEKYNQKTEQEKEELFQDYIEKAKKKCSEFYEYDYNFHVDKPQVEYVEVEKEHRRKGIGIALYEKAAKILSDRFGFSLYSSLVQTPEAQKVWEKLKEVFPVEKEVLKNPKGEKKVRYKINF